MAGIEGNLGEPRRNCLELTGRWERKSLTDTRAQEGVHAGYLGGVAAVLQVTGLCHYCCADDRVGDWGEYSDFYAGACGADEVAAGGGSKDAVSCGRSG